MTNPLQSHPGPGRPKADEDKGPPSARAVVKRACKLAQLKPSADAVNLAADILSGETVLPARDLLKETWKILDGDADFSQPVYPLAAMQFRGRAGGYVNQPGDLSHEGEAIVGDDGLRVAIRYAQLAHFFWSRGRGISPFIRAFSGGKQMHGRRERAIKNDGDFEYQDMSRALLRLGAEGRTYFDSVVLDHEWPIWLTPDRPARTRDEQEKKWLQFGLRLLVVVAGEHKS